MLDKPIKIFSALKLSTPSISQNQARNTSSTMSSLKRKKIGEDLTSRIERKSSSGLESAASSSPDPEVSKEKASDDVESPKTFKDLVGTLDYLQFEYYL
jgi:hypothetical protein